MALDRFSNIEEIQETNGAVRGVVWNQEDLDILQLDLKTVNPEQLPTVELHLYTIGSDSEYIAGGCIDDFEINKGRIYINYGKACQSLGIERGQFEVVINVYKDLLGSKEEQGLYIKEISDDRREVHIQALPNADLDIESYIDAFGSGQYLERTYQKNASGGLILDEDGNPILESVIERPISDDIAINLGDNQIFKIINQKDWQSENDFVVRLYKPLPEIIEEKQKLWTIEQLSDAYIDNITLQGPGSDDDKGRKLLGPNFDIDISKGTITETDFENWNSLLDANTSTSQLIVDKIFSGSLGQAVNIDYSGFQNFIHFSSATERLANFKYKLGLIEYYNERIKVLDNATGTDSNALQGNVITNRRRRDDVIGNFDGFERWLYNEPTSSLFTNQAEYSNNNNKDGIYAAEGGFIGAAHYRLSSFPKYLSGSKYYLHHSTSSIATTWYDNAIASASLYDNENNKSLVRSIPEHIRLDSNNSEYELFVNMIGHHYDILYTHIENLTKVYKPEEHPKLGQSKDTLYQVAESLGWKLENGNQATQLWQYKLGVDSGSGGYATTGSLFSKSNEDITTEVWRRIVNNLPYLLKTKGTSRSIKALMNTFGIPQTLLSIREYGGPKVDEDAPTLIEDRFSYALQFIQTGDAATVDSTTAPKIQHGARDYTTDIGTWGFVRPFLNSGDDIPPQTREFRFKPAVKQNMLLYTHTNQYAANDERINSQIAIQYTGSYSGSDEYGRIVFSHGKGESNSQPSTGSTEWVPLFDGNFWNLRWFWQATGSDAGIYNIGQNLNTTYHIQVQQASDYIDDKIIHQTSASYTPTNDAHRYGWNAMPIDSDNRQVYLGGYPGTGSTADQFRVNTNLRRLVEGDNSISFSNEVLPNMTMYSGSIQEYREWLEDIGQTTFDLHTTNPTSYVSGISPTSSFDTLVRHYPLGTDLNAVDHSSTEYLILSSSHPAQTIIDAQLPYDNHIISGSTFATMSNFPTPVNSQRGNYEPVEETYYIQGVSLGGNVPRSQKIRLEDNELVRRLSPKTSAERSRFDRAPIDTNKLGLFYSPADQINKEIFNHIGDIALDDYVGDPDHEFTFDYPDLSHFSKEYWKKYSDKNDINAYLRIFSQFDYSLFNQIKQLLPERVDEAMGLLVEPHALERAKVALTKKPVITNPQYDGRIEDPVKEVSGDTLPLTASIASPVTVTDSVSLYHVGSSGYSDSGNYVGNLVTRDPYANTSYVQQIFAVDQAPSITASITNIYAVAQDESGYERDNDHRWTISGGGNIKVNDDSYMVGNPGTNLNGLPYASDKIRLQIDTYKQTDTIQNILVNVGHKDSASGANAFLYVRLITTFNQANNLETVSESLTERHLTATKRVAITFSGTNERQDSVLFKDVQINPRTNITVELFYTSQLNDGAPGHIVRPEIDYIDVIQTISQANKNTLDIAVLDQRISTIFKLDTLHYSGSSTLGKVARNYDQAVSQSLGGGVPSKFNYSRSLDDTAYMDDFIQQTENLKYDGCRLVGPGINLPTVNAAIDLKPVVEIFETNPNTLIFNNQPNSTNPGNLEVR